MIEKCYILQMSISAVCQPDVGRIMRVAFGRISYVFHFEFNNHRIFMYIIVAHRQYSNATLLIRKAKSHEKKKRKYIIARCKKNSQ